MYLYIQISVFQIGWQLSLDFKISLVDCNHYSLMLIFFIWGFLYVLLNIDINYYYVFVYHIWHK